MAYNQPFNSNSFQKRTQPEEQKERKKVRIYTTEKIKDLITDLKKGYDVDMGPFFENDIELRDGNVPFKLTEEEYAKWLEYSGNAEPFIEELVQFMTDNGRTLVKLRDYQRDYIHLVADEVYNEEIGEFVAKNRNVICLQARQSNKTTTTVAYLLWYLCFHIDRNILIVANKGETAAEITKKLKDCYKALPFWVKPGIIVWNQKKILLDNGCSLTCKTTNKTSATGDTIHVLYFDEVAKIPKNISDDFWKSIYPTLSSSNLSQIILTSTPDGTENLFYRIWDGSQKGTNSFVNFRVDWWQVPGHDDAWAEKQRRDFGDEEFEQEFALSFESSTSKLLTGKDLQFFKRIQKEFIHRDISIFSQKEISNLYWHPDFNPLYDIEGNYFLFSVDTAEGIDEGTTGKKDSDYNVINIFRIQLNSFSNIKKILKKNGKLEIKDCFRLVQVGLYIDNDNDEEASAQALKKLVFELFKCGEGPIDNCRVLIEMNFNGKNFCNKFITHKNYYDGIIIKTYHTKPVPGQTPKKKIGYKTTGGKHGKNYYCELGAKMIGQRQIIVSQYNKKDNICTIAQLNAFAKRKGVYAGIALHDDIAVTVLFLCRAFEEEEFIEWIDQYLSELEDSALKSKIMYCLRRYDEGEPDMSDSEFTNSYLGSTSYNHNNPMRNPYSSNVKNPYSSQSTPGLPGSFTYGSLMKR